MKHNKLNVQVAGIRQLTPRIREYLLRSLDGSPLPAFEPGAHIELHTVSAESGPIVRHYSLIGGVGSWDDTPDVYRIAVQRENRQRGSAHIHDTFVIGTQLQVSRPKNHFLLDRRNHKTLLIAGGIGITPIYSMLRSIMRRNKPVEMVYAGRTAQDMAYAQDVLRLGGTCTRLHLSGPDDSNRLDLRNLLGAQPDDAHIYVCGPAPLIQAVIDTSAELGIDPGRVHYEMFSSGPSADDTPFDVELRASGRQVRVGRDTSILEALSAAGIHMMSDCRRGECGLCAVKTVESDGDIVHRDRYLDEEDRAAGNLCICVSRTTGSRLVIDA